jgi:hypothetical protein
MKHFIMIFFFPQEVYEIKALEENRDFPSESFTHETSQRFQIKSSNASCHIQRILLLLVIPKYAILSSILLSI